MPYDFTTGGSQFVTATELVTSIYDSIESGFYDVLYPEVLWRTVIPEASVKTDINPGAQNYVYRTRNYNGQGQFVNGDPANIPRVGQVVGQVTVPILDAAVGATITNSEARRVQYGLQTALAQEYGEIMKRAVDYHVERTFFFGNESANFESFLDYSDITKLPVPAVWNPNDPNTMVSDINGWLTAVWIESNTVHLPDTVFLPPEQLSMLTTAYVIGGGTVGVAMSAIEYLKANNIYTVQTGKPLNIRSLRYLKDAGIIGTTVKNRAIIMEWNDRNFVMPFPMAYQLSQPVPIPLGVDMFAEYIFGSYNVRYPMAIMYADGI